MINRYFKITTYNEDEVIVVIDTENKKAYEEIPFISKEVSNIRITRGRNHVMVITYKDKSAVSFGFGEFKEVPTKVKPFADMLINFIEENMIPLGYNGGKPISATLSSNNYYNAWQLSITTTKDDFSVLTDKATSIDGAITYFKRLVTADNWEKRIEYGEYVYRAKEPIFNLT